MVFYISTTVVFSLSGCTRVMYLTLLYKITRSLVQKNGRRGERNKQKRGGKKVIRRVNFFPDIKVIRNEDNFVLSQAKYLHELLAKFDL